MRMQIRDFVKRVYDSQVGEGDGKETTGRVGWEDWRILEEEKYKEGVWIQQRGSVWTVRTGASSAMANLSKGVPRVNRELEL